MTIMRFRRMRYDNFDCTLIVRSREWFTHTHRIVSQKSDAKKTVEDTDTTRATKMYLSRPFYVVIVEICNVIKAARRSIHNPVYTVPYIHIYTFKQTFRSTPTPLPPPRHRKETHKGEEKEEEGGGRDRWNVLDENKRRLCYVMLCVMLNERYYYYLLIYKLKRRHKMKTNYKWTK